MEFKNRKGIILAGGTGSRLDPITSAVCKQLMPVYDKPMIYYPISTLMLAGIKEFLIITTPEDNKRFIELLSDGSNWGINIKYKIQRKPNGIAEAFLIAKDFLNGHPSVLILGDNIFYGSTLIKQIKKAYQNFDGATVFAYPVNNPEDYGVVYFEKNLKVKKIEEKPKIPRSKYAVTGLYFYDESVVKKAEKVIPSDRGELEITAINQMYLDEEKLNVEIMSRGMAWLDTGTFESLNDASIFIRTVEKRQGLKVGCPEEIAWRSKWINDDKLLKLSKQYPKSGYGDYLMQILEDNNIFSSLGP